MEFFADKFKAVRQKKRFTIEQLSKEMSVTRATIWNWENEKRAPNETMIRKLAVVLEARTDEFSDIIPETPGSKELLNKPVQSFLLNAGPGEIERKKKFAELINIAKYFDNSLEQSSVVISAILDSMYSMCYIKDNSLQYIAANKAFVGNLAVNDGFVLSGKKDEDIFVKKEAQWNEKLDREVLKTGKPIIGQESFIPNTKKKKMGLITKQPIYDQNKSILGVVCIIVDITNRRAEEEKRVMLDKTDDILHFKYGIYDSNRKEIITLEHGEDRFIYDINFKPEKANVIEIKSNFKYASNEFHGAGVAIPVFSLRTKNGMGVGEFNDIKQLVDWCQKTGLRMIQILPVNDTVHTHTWVDTYPYSAISSFALHPMYLNIQSLNLPEEITEEELRNITDKLNQNSTVAYEEVMKVKSAYYKKIFAFNKNSFLKDKEYIEFFEQNKEWLVPYAAYSYLRDKLGTHDYRNWEEYSIFDKEEIDELTDPQNEIFDDIAIHYYIQFHLHKQLLNAANYARENGIILKGDIPIGVNKYGADTWVNPELFNMDCQTGAPPDDYAVDGQNWGFPTYNWEKMSEDNFLWWQKRFNKLAEYFDAYRIDHILGFFRIWEIPETATSGLLGYFSPANPVTIEELNWLNIGFDEERFCTPYIRDYIFYKYGNDNAVYIKNNFLNEFAPGCYSLLEKYNTQQKIKENFIIDEKLTHQEQEKLQKIKKILLELSTEVLLIKDKNKNNCYHPRITAHKTSSYAELDDNARKKFYDMYIDYFYKRQEHMWQEEAYKKLPTLINSTNMIACGEDLGMVPDCVPKVMDDLGLLSLKIQRMPKEANLKFGIPENYPYMSVCTPSCHDMSTIRGWWEEDGAKRQDFFNNVLGHYGEAPVYCEPWICKQILNQHLYSQSMWAIFPIQDLLATDGKLRREKPDEEKINEPSIIPHYWKYRFHINMEDLLQENSFNNHIFEMIENSGRNSLSY